MFEKSLLTWKQKLLTSKHHYQFGNKITTVTSKQELTSKHHPKLIVGNNDVSE